MNIWTLVLGMLMVTIIMGGEIILHYLPWRLILKGEDLPRPAAYVLGVSAILCPLSAFLLFYGYVMAVVVTWIAVIAAGMTVIFLYVFDYVLVLIWKDRESTEERGLRKHGKKG
jgi:hypothetical protein